MNLLVANGSISKMTCGSNFAYILNDNTTFLTTEYKVLHNQIDSCFVKCMKMLYNGKIQLYYLTNGLKSFASMIPSLDAEGFMTIVANLFADVMDVKHNGFLTCQNIDCSFDHIFVDPTTHKVSLVYLPVSPRMHDGNAEFENALRTELVKIISGLPGLASPRMMQLSNDLSNGMLSMEELSRRLKPGSMSAPERMTEMPKKTGTMRIVAKNAPTRLEIVVTKDAFVIGKKAELCDGVVGYNKMISRCHCRISRNGGQYTVTDLHSANGTAVNGFRLQPDRPHPIGHGDTLRLANSEFVVTIV